GAESTGRGVALDHLRVLAIIRLPDSGGTLRELVAAVQRPFEHSDRGVWGLSRAVAAPGDSEPVAAGIPGADRNRRLLADRSGDADRPGSQERDPDCGVCQGGTREWQGLGGFRSRRRKIAAS